MRCLLVLTLPEHVARRYREGLAAGCPEIAFVHAATPAQAMEHAPSIDMLIGFGSTLSDELFAAAERLSFVQSLGAGLDGIIDRPTLRPETLIANVTGIHGPPVSEAVFAGLLALCRNIPRTLRAQATASWDRFPSRLLNGMTIGICGTGVIGTAIADRARAFGMRAVALTAAVRPLEAFDEVRPRDPLSAHVHDLDVLVLATPLTETTSGLVDRTAIAALRPNAFLVNVGRGGLVDEAALTEALQNKKLRGAVLDVFEREPLPADHLLWRLDNVILTPHTSGMFDAYPERVLPTLIANLNAVARGATGEIVNRIR